MYNKQEQYEDEKLQRDLREQTNPKWKDQPEYHMRILGLRRRSKELKRIGRKRRHL